MAQATARRARLDTEFALRGGREERAHHRIVRIRQ
jgi:hypothetical protein